MRWPASLFSLFLIACGGGSGSDASGTLSGSVTGLTSSGLVLINGSETVSVAAGASGFSFASAISGSYAVKVLTQPDGQTCAISNGSGTISGNVSHIAVACRDYKLYVANSTGKTIALFGLTAGQPSALATATVSTGTYKPDGIVQSPDGQHLYLSYSNDKRIDAYKVASSGLLSALNSTSKSAFSADPVYGFGLISAISPDSNYLYSPNLQNVSQFAISSTGLSALSPSTASTGANPTAMAVTPNGKFAYVVNQSDDSISQFSVGSSGVLSALPIATVSTGSNSKPTSIAIDPNSSYLYVTLSGSDKVIQYSIGSAGGLSTQATLSTGDYPQGIAITQNGQYLYVTNAVDGTVSQYAVANGKLTALSTATVASGVTPAAIAVTPDSQYVYVANYGDNTVAWFSIGSGGFLTLKDWISANISGPTSLTVR